MATRIVVIVAFVFALFGAYVLGQTTKLPDPPNVFAGEDLAFQIDGLPGKLPDTTRGWVTGKLLVKINGRWVEARVGGGIGVVPAK